ncbi:hypothetical protein CDL15_Pgr029006 [Punica granatum]|nr:hypothetical protein CDL15_Pgr029006 [Punica granatum]
MIISTSSSSFPNSPEFEFWSMLRNPALPGPARLLSADELFSDGVLLPLDRLSLRPSTDPPDDLLPGSTERDTHSSMVLEPARPGTQLAATAEPASSSKRWRDIFKKSEKKSPLHDQAEDAGTHGKEKENKEKLEKGRRKEKRSRGGSGSSPELNINIWPFSRSRSAGNSGTRPMNPLGTPVTRKVSSAPCSRSNSAGDSKSRISNGYKWPNSPGRAGVHIGRSSPIWQPRRGGASGFSSRSSTSIESTVLISRKGGGGCRNVKDCTKTKARVLNVNIPTCIESKACLLCRGEAGGMTTIRAGGGGRNRGGSLFNVRGLFTKKVPLIN